MVVIVPANNEAGYIEACLASLLEQRDVHLHVVVSANACEDDTVQIARDHIPQFAARGHLLTVIESPLGGKLSALTRAEGALTAEEQELPRLYLDADVTCDPDLLAQIAVSLSVPNPCYSTGVLNISEANSPFTSAYGRFWSQLPFVKGGAVGVGCYAVNAAGRARWGAFPQIISDDTFVRLHFSPKERVEVKGRYHWPMIEGMSGLVRVRRRQDAGVTELRRNYAKLFENDEMKRLSRGQILRLALRDPIGFAAYAVVHFAVRLGPKSMQWSRGR
jgi:glycosyltransferase involved in cell wall biosynthesis